MIKPWAIFAPGRLTLKDITVYETYWAVVPSSAAPEDSGSNMMAIANAADEAGVIKKIDHTNATEMDPTNGFTIILFAIIFDIHIKAGVVIAANPNAIIETNIVAQKGTKNMSSGVFPDNFLPISVAIIAPPNALMGCPIINTDEPMGWDSKCPVAVIALTVFSLKKTLLAPTVAVIIELNITNVLVFN